MSHTPGTTAGDPADAKDRLPPALIRLGAVLTLGTFVAQMDSTMVNVALDTLRAEFDTTVSTIQWVMTGYLLVMALMIPLTAWVLDRLGARNAWLWSLGVFLVGSVLCGVAWSASSLIGFRLIQAVGGGMMLPLSQVIMATEAGPKRLGRLMAVIGVPALLGPVVGPMVGGVLVQDLTWRWIFFVNIPICLLGMILSWRVMPGTAPAREVRLDRLGLLLVSPALAAIVYGLSEAGNLGSFNRIQVIGYIGAGLVLLAAFAWHAVRLGSRALIDLRLLRSRNFSAASVMIFLVSMTLIGAMLLLPLYYQQVRGDSVLMTGLLTAPQGAGMAVGIALAGGLVDRFSARPIIVVGLILLTAGTVALAQVGAHTSTWLISWALVARGAGFGGVMVPAMAVCYRGLKKTEIPYATSAMRAFQQIGGSFGVALYAVILQRKIDDVLNGAQGRPDIEDIAGAFGSTYWWVVGAVVASVVPLLLLSRGRYVAEAEEDTETRPKAEAAAQPTTTAADQVAEPVHPQLDAHPQLDGHPQLAEPAGIQLDGHPQIAEPAGLQLDGHPQVAEPAGLQLHAHPQIAEPADLQLHAHPQIAEPADLQLHGHHQIAEPAGLQLHGHPQVAGAVRKTREGAGATASAVRARAERNPRAAGAVAGGAALATVTAVALTRRRMRRARTDG
jgi:EmrB/QacA subfamily drug resistance transporter